MALSDPRIIYGIHDFTPYNRTTKVPDWSTFKVTGGMNLSMGADYIKLYGGSQNFPWAVERGVVDAP